MDNIKETVKKKQKQIRLKSSPLQPLKKINEESESKDKNKSIESQPSAQNTDDQYSTS